MFRAFLVYAIEDYSKVPAIEGLLRQDFKGVIQTTDSPERTKKLLDELERRSGFMDWKDIPEPEYKLAATEIATNVNPYHIQWGITFLALKDKLGIEWARWSVLK
jgi:hypothetical protein